MLPIDVVVPSRTKLSELPVGLYQQFLLGGIPDHQLQVVSEGIGNANYKRNLGASKGKQPYIFFCDDDVLMKPGALMGLLEAALDYPQFGYYYGDFIALNHPCEPHNFIHRAGEFDRDKLRRGNYISTMSLVRRDSFEAVGGFDPKIERLQDLDLWLSMLAVGIEGKYVPGVLFTTDYTNGRITTKDGYELAYKIIKAKHSL